MTALKRNTELFLVLAFLAAVIFVLSTPQSATGATSTSPGVVLPILTYHSVRPYYEGITSEVKEYTVPPDIFDSQMQYMLATGHTVVLPDDVVNYFTKGTPLPPRPVMVTFDDGWENQYRYAFPILKKYNIPAVFYIYSGAVNHKHFLTWDEVHEMQNAKMVFGSHTKTHPQLPKITDESVLRDEIVGSKPAIEAQIGRTVSTFAYPFSAYTPHIVDITKTAYTSARAALGGVYQTKDDLFTLHGVVITGDFSGFAAVMAPQAPVQATSQATPAPTPQSPGYPPSYHTMVRSLSPVARATSTLPGVAATSTTSTATSTSHKK